MNKRIVCFLLALIMALGMIPNAAVTANAATKRTTSAKAIEVLMEKQGFKEKQYQVGSDWFIGYGSKIEKDSYPNGISKEDAIELVRDYVSDTVDDAINAFTKRNNLDLTQYQHDALALYTYRIKSTSWLDGGNDLYEAVRTGKSGNSFINTIAHAGSFDITDSAGLAAIMNYRLSEANMYLNNSYAYEAPSSMSYSIKDLDGDEKVDSTDELVAYSTSSGYSLQPVNETTFLGWYIYDGKDDDKIAGAPITKLNKDTKGKTVVAKFVPAEGKAVYAKYELNTSSLSSRKLFSKAYTEAEYKKNIDEKAIDTLKSKETFTVTKETMVDGVKWAYGTSENEKGKDVTGWIYIGDLKKESTGSNKAIATATITSNTPVDIYEGATADSQTTGKTLSKGVTVNVYEIKVEKTETGNKSWGKVSVNGTTGWINLAYADVKETSGKTDSAVGETGKIVNAENVNIRSSAEITATNKITTLKKGTKVTVLKTEYNGSAQWAYIQWADMKDGYTKGWVYMYYVELDDAPHSTPGNSGDVQYTGVVTSNINLNVRKSADIYAAKVGSLPTGTKVNVYETKTSKNMKWGRIGDDQWVCLTYVKLTAVENDSNGSGTATTNSIQATVTSATLDVFKNYNTNSEKVATLKKGDVVTILEKNTEKTETGSRIWGRIGEDGISGWINLAYAEVKNVTSVNGGNTGSSSGNSNGAVATIANCISVNVRKGAGVQNAQIVRLNSGTVVNVYEQVTKDNAPWARIKWDNGSKEGWVCMYYVEMGAGSAGTVEGGLVNGTNSNTISATGIVNSNIDLNVRAGAGLGYAKVGALKKGTKVTIYEQVTADGLIWGRMQYGNGSGWVCMSYITVESASSTGKGVMGTIARCFAAVNVRSAPGTGNAKVGTINVGTRVEVFETKTYSNQLWGRVAQGWICMDYVLLDSELPEGTILDATVPTTEATQAPDADEETVNKDGEIAFTIEAYIKKNLNVRNDANDNSVRVGTVKEGLHVDIRAIKNNGAEVWGRIDQYGTAGWINLDKANAYYEFNGYVNTDEQPIYEDANTGSTVKGTLSINTPMTITKVTTDGTNVYGWVEENIFGWIPMGKISKEEAEVIKTFKSGESVGDDATSILSGTTFAAVNAYDSIGGSKIMFKLTNGVTVEVKAIRFENGGVYGCIEDEDLGNYGIAWIDMSKVSYALAGVVNTEKLFVRSSMDASTNASSDPNNIVGSLGSGKNISVCQLSFDAYGNLWARITGNTVNEYNGAFVMIMTADKDGGKEVYVQLP